MTDTTDKPAWFDDAKHLATPRGTYERETGLALAADGLPIAGMIRAQRLAAAGIDTDPLGIVEPDLIAAEAARHLAFEAGTRRTTKGGRTAPSTATVVGEA